MRILLSTERICLKLVVFFVSLVILCKHVLCSLIRVANSVFFFFLKKKMYLETMQSDSSLGVVCIWLDSCCSN